VRVVQPVIEDMLSRASFSAIMPASIGTNSLQPAATKIASVRQSAAIQHAVIPVVSHSMPAISSPGTPPGTPPEPPTPARMNAPQTPPDSNDEFEDASSENLIWDPTAPTVMEDLANEVEELAGVDVRNSMFIAKPGVRVRVFFVFQSSWSLSFSCECAARAY